MNEEVKQCGICKKALVKRQKVYCGINCRAVAAGRAPGPKRQINCICAFCGKNYTLKKSQAIRSKYCSRKCQGWGVYNIRAERKLRDMGFSEEEILKIKKEQGAA